MVIVKADYMYNKYNKVFGSLAEASKWADRNGFTLVQSKNVPHIYTVSF